jgi:hypothetical protein
MLNCLIGKGCTMASEKQQTSGTTTVNQVVTPTADEAARNKLKLEQEQAYTPGQTEMFKNSFALGNQLLTSFGDKQGNMWQSLIGGVTPDQMNAQAMQAGRLTNASLNQAGMVDSGVGRVMNARAMSDSQNTNATFNVGALQNALNLALSGQAQIQSPASANAGQLASTLAGLRSTNQSGTSSQTITSMNPFLKSFQTGLGSALGGTMGGGNITKGSGWFGV